MSQKRKLTSYTIEQRYKVLTLLDKGEKASKIAKEYGYCSISSCFKTIKEEADGQEDEEEAEEKDETPMNSVQCLDAIARIRRFFQASNLPENVFDALTVLEDYALQQQITRKTKQTKITELFDNMIKKENN